MCDELFTMTRRRAVALAGSFVAAPAFAGQCPAD